MYIRDINERQNALAFISRLPNETLAAVFGYLRPLVESTFLDYTSPQPANMSNATDVIRDATLNIISVSHVCRHWREVAIEDSTLWSTPWLKNRPWTNEMLRRSRDSPLTVLHLPGQSVYPVNLVHLGLVVPLLFETRYARQLRLQIPPRMAPSIPVQGEFGNTLSALLCAYLRRDAPQLEILQLDFLGHLDPSDAQGEQAIIETLCGGHAPSLRELSITGLQLHGPLWHSPILSNLVVLILSSEFGPGKLGQPAQTASHSSSDLLRAVQKMSKLEKLCITLGGYPNFLYNSTYHLARASTPPVVFLSRLSHLELQGQLRELISLTGQLRLPSTAAVRYTAGINLQALENVEDEDPCQLVHSVANIPSTEVVEVTFKMTSELSISLRCMTRRKTADSEDGFKTVFSTMFCTPTPREPQDTETMSHLPAEPPFVWVRAAERLSTAVSMVSTLPPLDNPQELHWATPKAFSIPMYYTALGSRSCATILRSFPSVQRLVIDPSYEWRHVFDALASSQDCLPQLTSICLRSWVFYAKDRPDPTIDLWQLVDRIILYTPQTRVLLEYLRGFIRNRRSPLPLTLEIYEPSGFSNEMALEFRDIIPDLIVVGGKEAMFWYRSK